MKENKAITLISLVITIVIMLILAGVSINLLLGDNGLITKAIAAKNMYLNAAVKENDQMQNAILDEDEKDNGMYDFKVRKLISKSNIDITVEDILSSNLSETILNNNNVINKYHLTGNTESDKQLIINSKDSLENIMNLSGISQIKYENLLSSTTYIGKIKNDINAINVTTGDNDLLSDIIKNKELVSNLYDKVSIKSSSETLKNVSCTSSVNGYGPNIIYNGNTVGSMSERQVPADQVQSIGFNYQYEFNSDNLVTYKVGIYQYYSTDSENQSDKQWTGVIQALNSNNEWVNISDEFTTKVSSNDGTTSYLEVPVTNLIRSNKVRLYITGGEQYMNLACKYAFCLAELKVYAVNGNMTKPQPKQIVSSSDTLASASCTSYVNGYGMNILYNGVIAGSMSERHVPNGNQISQGYNYEYDFKENNLSLKSVDLYQYYSTDAASQDGKTWTLVLQAYDYNSTTWVNISDNFSTIAQGATGNTTNQTIRTNRDIKSNKFRIYVVGGESMVNSVCQYVLSFSEIKMNCELE